MGWWSDGHMMACRGRQICQPADIGEERHGFRPIFRVDSGQGPFDDAVKRRDFCRLVRAAACLPLLLCSFAAFAADGPTTRTIEVEGTSVRVDFESTKLKHGVEPIVTWIRRSMGIVARHYGQFPAKQ